MVVIQLSRVYVGRAETIAFLLLFRYPFHSQVDLFRTVDFKLVVLFLASF